MDSSRARTLDSAASSVAHSDGMECVTNLLPQPAKANMTEKENENRNRPPVSASASSQAESAPPNKRRTAPPSTVFASLQSGNCSADGHDSVNSQDNEDDDDDGDDASIDTKADSEYSRHDQDDVGDDIEDDDSDEDDTTENDFFSGLIMNIWGDSKALELAKPFCLEAANVIRENGYLFDALGHNTKDLQKKPLTNGCGIYVVLNKRLTAIEKIGMAKHLFERREYYKKKGIRKRRFVVIVDFNNTNETVNTRVEEIYRRLLDKMKNSDSLRPFQRFLPELLRARQGDQLGVKTKIILFMIESGFQLEPEFSRSLSLSGPHEFLMFDGDICDRMYEVAGNTAALIVNRLPKFQSAAAKGQKVHMWAVASWKPRIDGLSSKIEATKCILGEGNESNWRDTLDFSAIPDAKTSLERYSNDYTSAEKDKGRKNLDDALQKFLHSPDMIPSSDYGVLYVDTNRLILDEDQQYRPNRSDKSMIGLLTHKYGLVEVRRYLDGEIVLLLDNTGKRAVFVHKPLCVASCSLRTTKMAMRIRRSLTIAALTNVSRLLRGFDLLSPEDNFRNPINAILVFQIVMNGWHLDPKNAAAFAREYFSGPDTLALVKTNCKLKRTEPDAPVAKNLRSKSYPSKKAAAAKVQRPVNRMLVGRARILISQAKPGKENDKRVYDEVIRLFSEDGANSGVVSNRWRKFLQHHVIPDSKLHTRLTNLRDTSARSKGNRKAKGRTKGEVKENDNHVRDLVNTHGPTNGEDGTPFWIRKFEDSEPPTGHEGDYYNEYLVFEHLTFEGLRNHFKPKNKKNNSNAVTAQDYPNLKLMTVKPWQKMPIPPGCTSGYILAHFVERP